MERRQFIKTAAGASAALAPLASLAGTAAPMVSDFQLKIMATSWGYVGTIDSLCEKVKKEGYDGIEMWWPATPEAQKDLFAALQKHGLEIGFLAAGYESDFDQHFASFKKMVTAAATNTIQRPLYINCHSGKDYFSFDQNAQLVEFTIATAAKTGIRISHETHRSRMLFAAPVAKKFLQNIPGLRLTLDISHWCNVSESLLQDQPETVTLAIERADHIHARVGHPEGPQVNDPRAPEWANAVAAHFEWWDKIIARKKKEGGIMTILTEFGPPDYMPTIPYTRQALANQWEINIYMLHTLRKRYQSS